MKACLTIILLSTFHYALAQSVPVQTAEINLKDIFNIGFTGSGSSGTTVNLPMNGMNTLKNGIESQEIEVSLLCSSDFDLSVSSSTTNFSFNGPGTTSPVMKVKDVLSIMITENNTGGTIINGFTQYQPINGTTQKLAISSGKLGVRTFKFKYKAHPGFAYPSGTYTTSIIYTVVKK